MPHLICTQTHFLWISPRNCCALKSCNKKGCFCRLKKKIVFSLSLSLPLPSLPQSCLLFVCVHGTPRHECILKDNLKKNTFNECKKIYNNKLKLKCRPITLWRSWPPCRCYVRTPATIPSCSWAATFAHNSSCTSAPFAPTSTSWVPAIWHHFGH